MHKPQRWYEVIDGQAYVYDSPHSKNAQSMSIVKIADLQYYRNNFDLRKCWIECPQYGRLDIL